MKVPQRTDRHELGDGHLRDQLCRAVRVRLIPNLGHLRQFLREELARIPQQSITTLVGSMRKRLAECIASRGEPTFLAFLPSAHPHQYNHVITAKQQFVMRKGTERLCIFTQGKLHNSDSTSWYS